MCADTAVANAAPWFDAAELAIWCGGAWEGGVPRLHGVCHDSRLVRPGALYVALAGARRDGHDFIAAAMTAGAAAAMVRRDWPPLAEAAGLPLLRVEEPLRGVAAAAAGYLRAVAPFVVGVTGSLGKTTVKEWTAALLATAQPTAATRGNFNNAIGLPLSLLSMPRATRLGVFEVGSNHPGELAPLCRLLCPAAAIMTAIGPAHLEHFGSVEAIAAEKAELLRALPAAGFAVLEAGAPHFDYLRSQTAARIVTVGLDAVAADYRAIVSDERTGAFDLVERGARATRHLRLGLPGRHQVLNALLAVAAARNCAVSWEAIEELLPRLPRLDKRWQDLRIGGVDVINDAYNANQTAMEAALGAFAALATKGRRWLVLGEMRELGAAAEEAHSAVGACVARTGGDLLVAVGTAGEWMAAAACRAGFTGEIVRVADASAAGALLAKRARPGDRVLLKASRGVALERALTVWEESLKSETGAVTGGDCR